MKDKQTELLKISPSSKVIYVAADISSKEEIDAALEKIGDAFGPLDILVHNAAYFSGQIPAQEGNTVEFFKSFEANVKGTLVTTTAFLKYAVEDATIVNSECSITISKSSSDVRMHSLHCYYPSTANHLPWVFRICFVKDGCNRLLELHSSREQQAACGACPSRTDPHRHGC